MALAIMHGAQLIMVRGNFDDCLKIYRGLAEHYPVALVNWVNPIRLEGQKTASFQVVDRLRAAPAFPPLPLRNPGTTPTHSPLSWPHGALARSTPVPVTR